MTLLMIVGGLVVGFIGLLIGLRIVMVVKAKKQEGKAAPELGGKAGKWVRQGKPALLYFFSPNCGACRTMTPMVTELGKKHRGVFSVNLMDELATARKLGVMATPTTVVIDGGHIQKFLIGPQPEATLRQYVG